MTGDCRCPRSLRIGLPGLPGEKGNPGNPGLPGSFFLFWRPLDLILTRFELLEKKLFFVLIPRFSYKNTSLSHYSLKIIFWSVLSHV